MGDQEHNLIIKMIDNLSKTMGTGFDGVHNRQDTANGRTLRAEKDIDKLKKWRYYIGGGIAVLIFMTSMIVVPLAIEKYKNKDRYSELEARQKRIEKIFNDNFEIK